MVCGTLSLSYMPSVHSLSSSCSGIQRSCRCRTLFIIPVQRRRRCVTIPLLTATNTDSSVASRPPRKGAHGPCTRNAEVIGRHNSIALRPAQLIPDRTHFFHLSSSTSLPELISQGPALSMDRGCTIFHSPSSRAVTIDAGILTLSSRPQYRSILQASVRVSLITMESIQLALRRCLVLLLLYRLSQFIRSLHSSSRLGTVPRHAARVPTAHHATHCVHHRRRNTHTKHEREHALLAAGMAGRPRARLDAFCGRRFAFVRVL